MRPDGTTPVAGPQSSALSVKITQKYNMIIDSKLIDILLYGEEGVDLDFKRDQYLFTNASEEDKGELLKDILAFANSWRRSDAFILIGVKEVKGGKCETVGITEKLDDAQIQQFVNSKTQKPITFSYRVTLPEISTSVN